MSGSSAPAPGGGPALVHDNGGEYVPGQVIVGYAAGTTRSERRSALRAHGASAIQSLGSPRTQLVDLPAGTSVEEAVAALEDDPGVEFAQPNFLYHTSAIPNDTNFAQLVGLNNVGDHDIDAPEAWDITKGSAGIVVAVIDSGVAFDHPDLAPNMWVNPGDPAGGGDQDGNGLVDDIHGWDFVQNDNAPLDANGHGTHVAGTIGAQGNNALGVTGVNWDVSIMALRAGNALGSLTVERDHQLDPLRLRQEGPRRQRQLRRRSVRPGNARRDQRARVLEHALRLRRGERRLRRHRRQQRLHAGVPVQLQHGRGSSASPRPTRTTRSRPSPTSASRTSTSPRRVSGSSARSRASRAS